MALAFGTPASAAHVEFETVPVARGGRSVAIATLRDAPGGVDHLLMTFSLPQGLRVASTSSGEPDCLVLCNRDYVAPWHSAPVVVDHDLGRSTACYFGARAGFRPQGCDPEVNCNGAILVDIDLGRGDPIPDGADLLQCTIEAAADALPARYESTCEATVNETEAVACVGSEVAVVCEGDCNDDGDVVVGEVIQGIAIALEGPEAAQCAAVDRDRDGRVTIAEIIRARTNLLFGCGHAPATLTPNATPTPGP
jgi:hypothetical protein